MSANEYQSPNNYNINCKSLIFNNGSSNVALNVVAYQSFTDTWTNVGTASPSTPQAVSLMATRIGNIVILDSAASTNFTVTGAGTLKFTYQLPAGASQFYPTVTKQCVIQTISNSTLIPGHCQINNAGLITLEPGVDGSSWPVNAGNNFWNEFQICYNLAALV